MRRKVSFKIQEDPISDFMAIMDLEQEIMFAIKRVFELEKKIIDDRRWSILKIYPNNRVKIHRYVIDVKQVREVREGLEQEVMVAKRVVEDLQKAKDEVVDNYNDTEKIRRTRSNYKELQINGSFE